MALVLCMTAASAMAATHNVATPVELNAQIAAAVSGDIINVTADIDMGGNTIDINKSLTIKGNGNTIMGSAKKTFTINKDAKSDLINVTFDNVTIKNKASDGRCIDTRNGAFELKIVNSKLVTTGSGNNQALTIGGYDNTSTQNVIIQNSTIEAGDAGYCVISFVPHEITISGSTLNGYAALYFKDGSEKSVATLKNSTVNGNAHAGEDFGAIVTETEPIYITSSGNTYNVENKGGSDYAAFFDKNDGNTSKNTINSTGDNFSGKPANGIATITFNAVKVNLPQTGDNSSLMLWVSVMAMAVVGFVVSKKVRFN